MTDQTESEYAELLGDLDFYDEDHWRNVMRQYPGAQDAIRKAAAVIRALEAKVRESDAQHARDDEHYAASQTYSEKYRKNWVYACEQRDQVQAQLDSLHAMHDNLRDEYLAVIDDRDSFPNDGVTAMQETFEIGEAIRRMRAGARVARLDWNGKGQWLALQVPDEHSKMGRPYVYISPVNGVLVPWLASQTDLLADDWFEFEA